MEDVLFEFYIGDTYTRDFSITGWEKTIIKVFFSVKENNSDKNCILQKSLGNGITVVDEEEDTITYNLTINCTDTDNMKTDTDYVFDVEIVSNGTEDELIKKTIMTGTLRLKASVTKTCNEG